MARARAAPHERLALSAASFIPPGVCSPRPRGNPGVGTSRASLQRVADLLRLRELWTARRLALLTACPNHEEVSVVMVRPAVNHQVLRDAPGFSHGEVSRCLRSRQSIWCSPQGWDTPGFSHGEEVT
jgi:hypothetical protein